MERNNYYLQCFSNGLAVGSPSSPSWFGLTGEEVKMLAIGMVCGMNFKYKRATVKVFRADDDGHPVEAVASYGYRLNR